MSRRHALRGVIFDIDGTLVDSNDAHAWAWVDTFAEAGYDVPFEVVRPLIGMGGDKLLPKTIGLKHDSKEGKALGTRRSGVFRDRYLPGLRALPGSRALVERVRADGLKPIVATSAKDEELKGLLGAAEVADLMEEKATASDAKRSKPDPDIVLAAIEEAEIEAGRPSPAVRGIRITIRRARQNHDSQHLSLSRFVTIRPSAGI